MNNSTVGYLPEGRELWSATMHYDHARWERVRTPPLGVLERLGYPISELQRWQMLFVLQDIKQSRRPLHWSDAFYAWRVHSIKRGRRAPTTEEFLIGILPLVVEDIVHITCDEPEGDQ